MPNERKTIESEFHLPEPIRKVSQPFLRYLLLSLANYQIRIEGQLPAEPAILAAYPHAEHIDALFLPPNNIVFLAAADLLYTNRLVQVGSSFLLDTLPVVREEEAIGSHRRELERQGWVLDQRRKHLLIYPQGSRLGEVDSEVALLQQLKPGVVVMAKRLNKLVIPIGYFYPDNYRPRKGSDSAGQRLVRHFRGHSLPKISVVVRIGEPLEPPGQSRQERELFMSTLARELYHLAQ